MSGKTIFKKVAVVSSIAAITFFCYKFYVTYKMVKKEMEDEENAGTEDISDIDDPNFVDIRGDYVGSEGQTNDEIVDAIFEEFGEEFESLPPGYEETPLGIIVSEEDFVAEEGNVLRYEPNSEEALTQYIEMRLSDLDSETKAYDIMKSLFEFELETTCEEDDTVRNHIADVRTAYFGPDSKWNDIHEQTFAELVLHFAYLLNMDLERPLDSQVAFLLENIFGDYNLDEWDDEEVSDILTNVSHHTHIVGDTFGMFCLLDLPEVRKNTHFYDQYWKYTIAEMACDSGETDEY